MANAKANAQAHEEAVAAHRQWLLGQPEETVRARRELRGKRLGCWCAPHYACHGHNLAEIANCSDGWLCQIAEEEGVLEAWRSSGVEGMAVILTKAGIEAKLADDRRMADEEVTTARGEAEVTEGEDELESE